MAGRTEASPDNKTTTTMKKENGEVGCRVDGSSGRLMTAIAWLLLSIRSRAARPGARTSSLRLRASGTPVRRTVVTLDFPDVAAGGPRGRLRAGAHQIPFEET
jgi:hypothetical protein